MDGQQKYYVEYNEKEFIDSINEVCDKVGKDHQYKKNMELIKQIYNKKSKRDLFIINLKKQKK